MNKLEKKYADELWMRYLAKEIITYKFESIKFRLAEKTWYTPDFVVFCKDRIEIVEIKGFLREDANVKFKVCAELYPQFVWKMLKWDKMKGWVAMKEIKKESEIIVYEEVKEK